MSRRKIRAFWERHGVAPFLGSAAVLALPFVFLPYAAIPAYQVSTTLRNFYGVLRVEDIAATPDQPSRRDLINGTIVHGIEHLDSRRGTQATTYYGPESGAAIALNDSHERGSIYAGIIGLGAGTLAVYGRAGDRFTFYEINPSGHSGGWLSIRFFGPFARSRSKLFPAMRAFRLRAPANPKL